MSQHQAFRRVAVPQQAAQNARVINIPVPTRGIVQDENEGFMRPGAAIVQDNWLSTMRGVRLRTGCVRHCDVHSLDAPAWANSVGYTIGQVIYDAASRAFWNCSVDHTSSATGTFAAERAAHPSYWVGDQAPFGRQPIVSAFEYSFGTNRKMFAANETKVFDVTTVGTPVLAASGRTSGNYAAAQMSTTDGSNYLLAVNDTGDPVLRFDGTTWVNASGPGAVAPTITGPLGSAVVSGLNLVYVWKHHRRMFFIEANSFNAWYLPTIDAVGGVLVKLPLSGSFKRGGRLLFGATWTVDAGDGLDNKCCFVSTEGEVALFSGTNPSDILNWRQDGIFQLAEPMGMNAHFTMGGDLLVLTTEGILPLSQAIQKTAEQLDLASLTRSIKRMWREEVKAKRGFPWTARKWDEYGGIFVTVPGGDPGNRYCLAANNATIAWSRFTGWDATCWLRLGENMFFGTQDGFIMQMDRTGKDDGQPYVATLVGGWELFQSGAAQSTWHQARASFMTNGVQPFIPQLDAALDYVVELPPPPPPGELPPHQDVWDQGQWDEARWDQASAVKPAIRNTLWISIGKMGFSHAPIVQVTVAQDTPPDVELLVLAATSERAGVTV